jgi:hypothetical protein
MIDEAFNLDDLLIPDVAAIDTGQLASKRKPRRKDQFVKVPLEWMYRLAGARYAATPALAHHLLFRSFQERRDTIKLANGLLALLGINRCQKRRALVELEAMGLVVVEHRERKSPNVTLLYPEQGA